MKKVKAYVACMLGVSIIVGNLPTAALASQEQQYDIVDYFILDEDANLASPSKATTSNATSSNLFMKAPVSSIGDIWDAWSGKTSFEFLGGSQGNGSKEKPYLIKNREQLMGLSELTAMGMVIQSGTGSYVGDYHGDYFALAGNIDMQGVDWNPIGFFQDSSQINGAVTNAFEGNFDGNGYSIKNLKLNTHNGYDYVGLFGAVNGAEIKNLTIIPDSTYYVTGKSKVGILAGEVENSTIKDITIRGGAVNASGIAGGAIGAVTNCSIENVTCDNVKVDSQTSTETIYVGGITGQATSSVIIDCQVTTGNSLTARIQGKGYVGGITGSQNATDIYNTYVSGTIGGNGSTAIGGITGEYVAGKLKVARFEGVIANSYLGVNAKEGSFIGTRKGAATNFNYVEDVAYLFADTQEKIVANVCGSGISDDNDYTYAANVGFSHAGDNYYSLVAGGNTKIVTDKYYYEILEEGILSIMDSNTLDEATIDHYAPNATGKPVRGYLVMVEQIDTLANSQHYYDVASMTVQGSSQYCKPIDKDNRGAIAFGDKAFIVTAPNNTETEKYQMEGVPFYKYEDGSIKNTTYDTASKSYVIKMPTEDIVFSAIYKKVAVNIKVEPSSYSFVVTQTRTGNRKNPTKTTVVKNMEGKLIATYINGSLQQGTQVQPVDIKATIDTNNDVSDNKVKWSIDDPNLITLIKNADEEGDGYTSQSASIRLNMDAQFFTGLLSKLEQEQAASKYADKIPNTIFGAGHQNGGVAVLTAQTRPATSFEGKPCTANSRINVTFQVLDNTFIANEGAALDKQSLEFTVTRSLSGDRKAPTETLTVTAPQTLTASFTPDFFSRQDVTWVTDDVTLLGVSQDATAYKDVLVSAHKDAKWIKDIMAVDDAVRANDINVVLNGSGQKQTIVSVIADDKLGNRNTAACHVTIVFNTVDTTWLRKPSTGGGGGGSSSGGGGSSGVTPGGAVKGNTAPAGSVTGSWVQNAAGKWLFSTDRTYVNEWAFIHNPYASTGQSTTDWFYFDKDGFMVTGWYTDEKGNTFFLNNKPDGTSGKMLTGWQWIFEADGIARCYYFNTDEKNGVYGSALKNTITPDGYQLNETGVWVVDGIVQTKEGQ